MPQLFDQIFFTDFFPHIIPSEVFIGEPRKNRITMPFQQDYPAKQLFRKGSGRV
ncbi:MAG: hypothetical protein WAW36_05560 [Methylovulum miyakonense]|uniref:hypothetical protein n=1 Tax=Methylovulum miyakonense TaxID=645578 RepID=UPI003BB66BE9